MSERIWSNTLIYDTPKRKSELCKAKDFYAEWYKKWAAELNEPVRFHRKQWEFIYIMQALWERDCIKKGKRGLVFAVGTEPLPSVFARHGCSILATDIFPEEGKKKGWETGNQLCFGLESLNTRNLIDNETLHKYIAYKPVDMNMIPGDLKGFDFNWSSCSFEHLGAIDKGFNFLEDQLKTLKPGGWAVHTTEYNLTANDKTLETGDTVIYRHRDIEEIVARLRKKGHFVEELDYSIGGLPEDFDVDVLPHLQKTHLKLQINEFVVTSIGLIIRKKKNFF